MDIDGTDMFLNMLLSQVLIAALVVGAQTQAQECPGYSATNVKTTDTGLTADLGLAGTACNRYGTDLRNLTLSVTYENGERMEMISCLPEKFTDRA